MPHARRATSHSARWRATGRADRWSHPLGNWCSGLFALYWRSCLSSHPPPRRRCPSPRFHGSANISRIKQLLVDPDAILPQPIVAFTLQEAKDALDLLAVHARQLAAWQKESISDAQRAEIVRLRTLIPHIRPLIQRLIALATALDRRAQGGGTWPRRKWRH